MYSSTNLREICDTLKDSDRTMDQSFSKAFSESGSSAMGKLKSKARRTFRARSLRNKMDAVDSQIKEASSKLLHLISILSSALKIEEHQAVLVPKIDNLRLAAPAKDVYVPRRNTPALTATVKLDFDAKDAEGMPATPEAILKQSVLSSDSSNTVTAATGVMKSAHCIVGMAGVGKTVALRGLAHDKDVRARFPHGIFYMTLGQGATVEVVIREIVKILCITGGKSVAVDVGAVPPCGMLWIMRLLGLKTRYAFFLVDDIWPVVDCRTGFLTDLRQLLRESSESRMAISTRSTVIAQCAGAVVMF